MAKLVEIRNLKVEAKTDSGRRVAACSPSSER